MVRLLGSFVAACVVVGVMLLIAVELWGGFDRATGSDEPPLEARPLDLLVGYDSLDVAELFGEPRRQLPELEPPPPPLQAPPVPGKRGVQGFVQVEVDVDARGRVVDARVLDAAPAGVYESEALSRVRSQRFPVGQPGTRIRIVDFSVERPESP
ncbi:MAG: energy transducer TonB [Gammaproteobacteria bacterium]|jgi:TonB family protein